MSEVTADNIMNEIRIAIQRARAEEREACARVADEVAEGAAGDAMTDFQRGWEIGAIHVASKIRSRTDD